MTARLIALLLPLLLTQGTFEGTLRMRTIELDLEEAGLKESWLDVTPATLAAREDVRVDSSSMQVRNGVMRFRGEDGGEGYGLIDFGRRVIVMVDPSSRAYFELPLPGGPPPQAATAGPRPALRTLGQRTINGIVTTGYEARAQDLIIRGWMTQAFPGLTGSFRSMSREMGDMPDPNDPEEVAKAQLMQKGFPVLVITLTDRSLKVEETRSIQSATLGADLFKVPAGFTKQTLPGGP